MADLQPASVTDALQSVRDAATRLEVIAQRHDGELRREVQEVARNLLLIAGLILALDSAAQDKVAA